MTPWRYKNPPYTAWHYADWFCKLMNIVDVRFKNCECHWMAPYGMVLEAGCEKHDS